MKTKLAKHALMAIVTVVLAYGIYRHNVQMWSTMEPLPDAAKAWIGNALGLEKK